MHGRWSTWILQSNFASHDWRPMTLMKTMHWTPLRPDAPWLVHSFHQDMARIGVADFLSKNRGRTQSGCWIAGLQMAVLLIFLGWAVVIHGIKNSGFGDSKAWLLGDWVFSSISCVSERLGLGAGFLGGFDTQKKCLKIMFLVDYIHQGDFSRLEHLTWWQQLSNWKEGSRCYERREGNFGKIFASLQAILGLSDVNMAKIST